MFTLLLLFLAKKKTIISIIIYNFSTPILDKCFKWKLGFKM